MKRYECPRCGAGVRPTDTQCGRCGAVLSEDEPATLIEKVPSIVLEDLVTEREIPVKVGDSDHLSASRFQKILESRERELKLKERELEEKEKRLLEAMEQLEKDMLALEETAKRIEEEEMMLKEREKALRERETELQKLSRSLEAFNEVLSQIQKATGKESVSASDIEKLIAVYKDFKQALDSERKIIRQEVMDELKDRFEELNLLKDQFKAARKALEELPKSSASKKREDIAMMGNLIGDLYKELDSQIGAGSEIQGNDESISTGIAELDNILAGGIPRGHVILVSGVAGAMKTSLVYSIMYNSALKEGRKGLYFSLEQSRESILRQMEKMGMVREKVLDNLMVVDMIELRKTMKDEPGDWRKILMKFVEEVVETKKLDFFALDSLESFKALSEFAFTREDLAELFDWFRSLDLTTLLITGLPIDSLVNSREGELYLADGVLELQMKEIGDQRVQRWIRCVKMRGVNVDPRYYLLKFENGAFHLQPLVVGLTQ